MIPTFANLVPRKTVERLSEYRRSLISCQMHGITHIYSHTLAEIHGITAVQVRRDLMLVGFSSDSKKGYDVKELIAHISSVLDSKEDMNIAIIGMGRIGQAINSFFKGKRQKLHIVAAFDIDPAKVGTTIDNVPCYHIDSLAKVVAEKNISIAIIASPMHVAHLLVEPIVEAGIKGVVNFTTVPLNFPPHIISENDDVTAVVEKVAYFVKELNQ